jgi:hypothetical protein
MNRFDHKYNCILNEIFGTLASAAGSFLKAGQDPAYLFNMKNQGKKGKKDYYGPENPPKVGKFAVYTSNPEITGLVRAPLNKQGQFGIFLMKPNKKPSDYVFVKTASKPYSWRLDYLKSVMDKHQNGKDKIVVENNVEQLSPSKEIPYIMVGKNTKFDGWMSYDDYLKQNKK